MKQLNFRSFVALLCAAAALLTALPAQAQEAAIRKALTERLPNLPKIDEITRTPMPGLFEVRIDVEVKNSRGVLAQVASSISSAEADIVHLDMDPENADETIELRLLVSVRDRIHFADVLRTLRRSPVVVKVARYRLT